MFSHGAFAPDSPDGKPKKRLQAMDEAVYYPCSPGSKMKNRQGIILNRDSTLHYGSHGHRSRNADATRTKYRPLSANMERLATPKSIKRLPEKPKTPLWIPSGRVDPNKFSPYKSIPGYTDDGDGGATALQFTASLRTPLSTPNRGRQDLYNRRSKSMPEWFDEFMENRQHDMASKGFVFQQPNLDEISNETKDTDDIESDEKAHAANSNSSGVTTKTPVMSFDTFLADLDDPEAAKEGGDDTALGGESTAPVLQHLQSLLDQPRKDPQGDTSATPSILETENVDDLVNRVAQDELGKYEPLQRLLYIQYYEEVQQADRLQHAVDEVFAARDSNNPEIEQIMSELETLTAQAMSLRYTHMEQVLKIFQCIENDEDVVEDDMFGHVDDTAMSRNSPFHNIDNKEHLQGRLTALQLDQNEHDHLMDLLDEDVEHARETIKALEELDEHKQQADQYRLQHMRAEWDRIQHEGDAVADQVLRAQTPAETNMV